MRDADDFTVGGGKISGVPAGTDRKRGVVKSFDVFSQSGNMPLVRSAAAAENADSAREHLSTDLGKFSDGIGTGIFVPLGPVEQLSPKAEIPSSESVSKHASGESPDMVFPLFVTVIVTKIGLSEISLIPVTAARTHARSILVSRKKKST